LRRGLTASLVTGQDTERLRRHRSAVLAVGLETVVIALRSPPSKPEEPVTRNGWSVIAVLGAAIRAPGPTCRNGGHCSRGSLGARWSCHRRTTSSSPRSFRAQRLGRTDPRPAGKATGSRAMPTP
jgi:hypothetical protein